MSSVRGEVVKLKPMHRNTIEAMKTTGMSKMSHANMHASESTRVILDVVGKANIGGLNGFCVLSIVLGYTYDRGNVKWL
mgnify:CR=1 FL=1